jgi:hypothetical protein
MKNSTYESRPRLESFCITVLWSMLVFRVALPQGLNTLIGQSYLSTNSSAQEIRDSLGPNDAGSYLEVALTWAKFQAIDFETQSWIVRIWSPGLSMIEIPLLWLEKLGISFFWTFLLSLILLWASACYLFWRYVANKIGVLKSVVLLILITFSWDFKFIFNQGILNAEGFSLVLLLISLLGITYVMEREGSAKLSLKLLLGSILGISIWVRHTNDAYLFVMLCISGFLLGLSHSRFDKYFSRKQYQTRNILNSNRTRNKLWDLNNIVIFAILITIPWRIISTLIFKGQLLQMSSAFPLFSRTIWAYPGSESATFWGPYGSNWACKIDLDTCSIIASTNVSNINSNKLFILAVESIFKNPKDYFYERSKYFLQNWIPSSINQLSLTRILAWISLIILILVIVKICQLRIRNLSFVDLIWIPIITLQLVQLSIIHFESRYFITLRITCLIYLLLKTSKIKPRKVFT